VDRYCVKQPHVKGACSAVTGDALPEIEQCQGGACIYQVQFESVRDEWFDFLKHAEVYYSDKEISVLEKIKHDSQAHAGRFGMAGTQARASPPTTYEAFPPHVV
jgi:hypothetical protein